MNDLSFDPGIFSGRVRLFPVPQLVMFPHVMQSLHVFEPRYRSLLSHALRDDQLIAMPVLTSGPKVACSLPSLEPVACLTKIISHQRFGNGRSNLLVAGVARIRLLDELPPDEMYRQARAEILFEHSSCASSEETATMRTVLVAAFKKQLTKQVEDLACLDDLLDRQVSLSVLTDLIAHTLELDWATKLQLLSDSDVDGRVARLRERLVESVVGLVGASQFPPAFSAN